MNNKFKLYIFYFFIIFTFICFAQYRELKYDDLFNIKNVNEVAISPDKKFIAYNLIVPRPLSDKPGTNYSNLFIYDISKKNYYQLLPDNLNISSIAWNNNSTEILFIAKLDNDKFSQIYSISKDGGKPKKVFSVNANILSFQLSPDEKKMAFIRLEDVPQIKNTLLEKGFDAEIYEEEYLDRNLYIYDLIENKIRQLTFNVSVFEFDWSPCSKNIVAAITDKNLVDDSYMFKRIFIVNVEDGSKYKLVNNPGKLNQLKVSPDGKHLAFVSAANINDAVSGSLFICQIPNNKSFDELKNYSENKEESVISIEWKNNNTVILTAEEGVDITLIEQQINSDTRKIILKDGKTVINKFDYLDNLYVLSANSAYSPNELFMLTDNQITKLTKHNDWLKNVKLAKQEKIEYLAKDGLRIEGILIYPLNFEKGKRYPLINYIHGGPEAAIQNGWNTGYASWGQFAAAKDYFVFMPNYRASSGRGLKFTMMGFGDLAGKEFEDVLDGIDHLIKIGYVDSNYIGIGGGSYGGYFSAWAATKYSHRFKASVVFVGIGNQISKRFTTDIPFEDYYVHWGFWTYENDSLVWDRSPVKYAHLSKTPTLILHGKQDTRVHYSQGLELYRALKLHSKAAVRLIIYPDQGHGNSKNTSRYDYLIRTMQWFDFYLKEKNSINSIPPKFIEF